MFDKRKRKAFVVSNEYQARIVLLTFFPSLFIFIAFTTLSTLLISGVTQVLLYNSPATLAVQLSQWSGLIVFVLCLIFISALIFSFFISRDLVGAFGRIIRELDEVIEGRSKKLISARPEDKLANELLKRVNILIQSYIANKK